MHLKVAIALLSAAAIAYEILLIRIFSITQWHHFAGMIISLALLGYGMSGTVLTLLERWFTTEKPHRWKTVFGVCAVLFGVSGVACAVLAQRIPFNPLAVVWDPRQFLYLLALYLLLAIPFLCAAMAIGVALMSRPNAIDAIYGADLVGAGIGAAALLACLFVLPISGCLRILGGMGCLAAWVLGAGHRPSDPIQKLWLPAITGMVVVVLWPRAWLEPKLSEYKELHKALLIPGAEKVAETSGPMGLLTVVRNSRIPFRHAPGLSLSYSGTLPDQLGVFTDGGALTVIDRVKSGEPEAEYLRHLPAALAYSVVSMPSVLIVGVGGGSEVLMAIQHGAASVNIVESNPQRLELLSRSVVNEGMSVLDRPDVALHVADPRSFLRHSDLRFDLIQIPLAQSLGGASSGSQAVGMSHLFTVESFVSLLGRLHPNGMLVTTQWLKIPPRENLKLYATLIDALTALGVKNP